MSAQFQIEWTDRGREPTGTPDPLYPKGVDLDCSAGRTPSCKVDLPYPAKRIGFYYVQCTLCKTNALITTAGKVDDPRSLTLPCRAAAGPASPLKE